YNTAVIGKWHLKTTPVGFDHWEIFPGQGDYYNPVFIQMDGTNKRFEGYATDLTTDKALAWLDERDKSKPFFLMCQHKAPHRTFAPALRHLGAFDDVDIEKAIEEIRGAIEKSNNVTMLATQDKTMKE
ncbi:MAG: sulfatase-like hydrolase/transferase, partial [Glaciimonas sp.]|nr:sulfatase-like hydrolase/transferase [Glaciimonas sp.]